MLHSGLIVFHYFTKKLVVHLAKDQED